MVQRVMSFKDFFFDFSSSGGQFVQRSKTICAVLVDFIKGIIHVILFQIWTSGSGEFV